MILHSTVDCEWEYGEFEQCSATCGNGQMSRFPIITQHPMHGGVPCPPNVVNEVPDTQPCNLRECPGKQLPVVVGEILSLCSAATDFSSSANYHKPHQLPVGFQCGLMCSVSECCFYMYIVDCEWEYGEFGDCSSSCGAGIKLRYPIITVHPQHGGRECPVNVINNEPDEMECDSGPCPGKSKGLFVLLL